MEKKAIEISEIFYKGTDIENQSNFVRLQFIDEKKVKIISDLLESIVFKELIKYYDNNKMSKTVYKLTMPDKFILLEEEFYKLKEFYKKATSFDAFVIVKIS